MTTTAIVKLVHDSGEVREGTATIGPDNKPQYVSVPLWGAALKVVSGYVMRGHTRTGWRVEDVT